MPTIDELLQDLTPSNPLSPKFTPTFSQYPRNQTAILRKYSTIGPLLGKLSPQVRNTLINIDSSRVAGGASPLTQKQTLAVLSTAIKQEPFTPPPDRSIWNLPGNFIQDLSSTVKAIPRLPMAFINEIQQLPSLPAALSKPGNPIVNLMNAPGIRFLPLTYTISNLARGPEGWKEAVTHPFLTTLDLMPGADYLARGTRVGKLALEEAAKTGARPRALAKLVTSKVSPEGELIKRPAITKFTNETIVGQTFARLWGDLNRKVSRELNRNRQMAVNAITRGEALPDTTFDEIATLGRRAHNLTKDYEDLVPKWPELYDKFTVGDFTNLSPRELSFVGELRDLTNQTGLQLESLNDIGKFLDDMGRAEFYDRKKFEHLSRMREARNVARTQFGKRIKVETPDLVTRPNQMILDEIDDLLKVDDFAQIKDKLFELEARGFDTRSLRESATRKAQRGSFKADFHARKWDKTELVENYTTPEIIKYLENAKRTVRGQLVDDKKAVIIAHSMRKGHWADVTEQLDDITKRADRSNVPPWLERNIKSLRDRAYYLRDLKIDKPRLDFFERQFEREYSKTPPDRFLPYISQETRRRFTERTIANMQPEEAGRVAEAIRDSIWNKVPGWFEPDPITGKLVPGGQVVYRDIFREVTREWRTLRENGMEPLFVHTVRPHKVGGVMFPLIGEVPNNITAAKARTMNLQPGIKDFSVALTHQAIELITRRSSEQFIDHIVHNYGVKESELREAFIDKARAAAERDPRLSVDGHLQRLMNKGWKSFDPDNEGYFWGSKKLDMLDQERYWIPKHLAQTLRDLHDPKSLFGGVLDPVSKLFRTSVVALSPRTLLYNIIGGSVMTMGQAGPGIFRHAREAWRMVNDPQHLPSELKEVGVGQMGKLFEELDAKGLSDRPENAARFMSGVSLRRWWDEIQQSKTGKVIAGIPQKSYNFNSLIDDWYRAMAFLSGKDKALAKGLSQEQAIKAGVELTRKSLQDWMGMTPLERSIMKSIFPFYGFMQHAIRYVLQYPIDHPLRAEIMGKFAYAELQDQDPLLPHKFLSWAFLGKPDTQGKQTGLSLGSFNPFGDVGNLMTLQGFLGASNPLIQTVLESVGVTQGRSELYPSLRYDPESGRLQATHTNPLLALAHNVVPQSELLSSLLGINSDFNEQLRRNPAAAVRRIASSAGLPILWRQFNPTEEIMRAELARLQAATDVKNEALKTGSWTNASRYDSLRPILDALKQASPQALSPFQPTPEDRQMLVEKIQQLTGSAPTSARITSLPQPSSMGSKLRTGGI